MDADPVIPVRNKFLKGVRERSSLTGFIPFENFEFFTKRSLWDILLLTLSAA